MKIDIIAEIAGGHLGKKDSAVRLIELAAQSGASSVKFQFYRAHELCHPKHADYELFKSLEFGDDDWSFIQSTVNKLNLKFYADVFGNDSFEEATRCNVDGYKIHTADLDNRTLLSKIALTNKLILLGVGGRKRVEIFEAIKFIRSLSSNSRIVLMPGHQLFPTPPEEHWIKEIKWFTEVYKDYGIEVGCSDHIDGDHPLATIWPIAAVGAGATIIEKHLTIDRKLKLEDYESALNPEDFKTLATTVRLLEPSLENYPNWSEGRDFYRKKAVKVPLASCEIHKDTKLTHANISYLRSERKIDPMQATIWENGISTKDLEAFCPLNGLLVKSKIGILVNARSASTRLPRKALLKINGKETILLLLERVRQCKNASDVVFCTTEREDDNELAKLVEENGYKVFRGPDEKVADRLLFAAEKYQFEHIVRVTGDDLLRDIPLMEKAIESHLETNADYTDIEGVVYSCNTEIISTRALRAIVQRANAPENTEYLSWYLDDASAFVQNRVQAPDQYNRDYRLTLDTQEDFLVFEKIFSNLHKEGKPVELLEALDFLDKNPDVSKLNQAIFPKLKRESLDLLLRM